MSSENSLKFDSLKKVTHSLLSSQMMTTRELVACLMSEPYSVAPGDLNLITDALNYLMSVDAIQVGFKTDRENFNIEASFVGIFHPLFCFRS